MLLIMRTAVYAKLSTIKFVYHTLSSQMHQKINDIMASNCDFDSSIYAKYYLKEEEVPELDLKNTVTSGGLLQQLQAFFSEKSKLLTRKFIDVSNDTVIKTDEKNRFRVMQWNILAEGLSFGKDNFIRCPPEALDWNFRRLRLLEEILTVSPDILCLQEVDHFGFLFPIMEKLGYKGSFFPKPDSPCLFTPNSNGPDGCAMFYRTSKFDSLGNESIVLRRDSNKKLTNQVSIIHRFALRDNPKLEVAVATTHLKAKNGWEELRKEQGIYLINYLHGKFANTPLIICGDFNAEHSEPVYQVFAESAMNLGSAYRLLNQDLDCEPRYSTWKIRGGSDGKECDICHTIDYIWYTRNHLQVKALLDFPTEQEIGPDRLPSYQYPSDHFSLAADFIFELDISSK